ncbi:hypothetical protein SLEP1_g38830 [Rubroshorea leprosula]|uniref:Glucose-induced degradation protein 4 homolog n=1 Tax=Rubroshorea leprosula TaxID=152421 RepID=A0AAV5KYN7_9ROSI|nr:hypothetical protein SLEP1_g38830 [Rubroshorea leprosula]
MAASSSSSQDPGTNSRRTSLEPVLSVGRAFTGHLKCTQPPRCWGLHVRIQGCDLERGYICGIMEVLNLQIGRPVVTFWEGEIVDMKNHTFYTGKWHATPQDDINYWASFSSALGNAVQADGGNSWNLSDDPFIFMRWKEQRYVSEQTDSEFRCMAGFYYVAFSIKYGTINATYHKPGPGVTHDQEFSLAHNHEERWGVSSSSYELQ